MKRRVFIDPAELAALSRQDLTAGEIASRIGCSAAGVSKALKMHGLARWPRGRRAGADHPKRPQAAAKQKEQQP